MTDAVKMAIERVKARFHPHYGIDGASDSKQLASDCQTIIAALEQAGEQVADENSEVLAVLAFAKARSWHHFGVAWDKLEKVSQDELVEQAAAFLIAPAPEALLPALQRLGQEFDAGEAKPVAYRFVHLDYAGRKVSRYGAQPERVNGHDPIETHPLYAHPPQSRVAAEPVGLREDGR